MNATPDPFASLGWERRPWLDEGAVKERFIERAAASHPDRVRAGGTAAEVAEAESQFSAMNEAQRRLRDPAARLEALLEMEGQARPAPVERVAGEEANVMFEVGALCAEIDRWWKRAERASTAVARASLTAEQMGLMGRVKDAMGRLMAQRAALESECRALDARWGAGERDWAGVRRLLEQFRYNGRGTLQLNERLGRLASF